jgi:uncharacterized membrane protein YbhN (UPF0104 family)
MWLRLGKMALVLACLAGLVWLVASMDLRKALDAVRQADPILLAISLLPLAARFLIWNFKATRIARRHGQVRSVTVMRLILAGAFINLVTPTVKVGGGLYRAAGIRRETGWGFPRAYGWTLSDQVSNILGGLLLFGLTALAAGGRPFYWGGGVALFVVAVFFVLRSRFRREGGGRLRELLGPVLEPRTAELAGDVTLAALAWSMLCVACGLVFHALGSSAPLMQLSAMLAVGTTAGTLAGAGGLGVTELALIGLLTRAGIDPAVAAAGALLHRGTLYAVVIIAGGFALLSNRRSSSG